MIEKLTGFVEANARWTLAAIFVVALIILLAEAGQGEVAPAAKRLGGGPGLRFPDDLND